MFGPEFFLKRGVSVVQFAPRMLGWVGRMEKGSPLLLEWRRDLPFLVSSPHSALISPAVCCSPGALCLVSSTSVIQSGHYGIIPGIKH